jgi:hypothetical protein
VTVPTSVFQQQTIAGLIGDWAQAQTLAFNQFNPSGGDLVDAVFTTAGSIEASASIENLAPVAATVDLNLAATVEAWAPDILENMATVQPTATATVTLPALPGRFDGTLDFAGPSGTVLPDITGSQTQAVVVTPGTSGTSDLVGTGTFDVGVNDYAVSTVNGTGNLAVSLHGSVGVTVSVQYDASTPNAGPGDDGGGVSIVDLGYFPSWTLTPSISNSVTTSPQFATFHPETSGSAGTASFAQFDPSLGTLDEILVNVGNVLTGTFAAENLETVAASITMTETAGMTVATPGGVRVSSAADSGDTLNLGAFDGSADFAGTSGRSDTIFSAPASFPVSFGSSVLERGNPDTAVTDSADLKAFTGTGTVALPVGTSGTSSVTGPTNLLTEMTQRTGGTVEVSYVYTPFASAGGTAAPTGSAGNPIGIPLINQYGTLPGWKPIGSPGLWADEATTLTFIGGFTGPATLQAQPYQSFLIGPGASATIDDFSLLNGDRLNLLGLLAGAPLAHDLSNLGSFVTVAADPVGQVDTTLSIHGPGGAAALVLASNQPITLADLVNGNALVLPSH